MRAIEKVTKKINEILKDKEKILREYYKGEIERQGYIPEHIKEEIVNTIVKFIEKNFKYILGKLDLSFIQHKIVSKLEFDIWNIITEKKNLVYDWNNDEIYEEIMNQIEEVKFDIKFKGDKLILDLKIFMKNGEKFEGTIDYPIYFEDIIPIFVKRDIPKTISVNSGSVTTNWYSKFEKILWPKKIDGKFECKYESDIGNGLEYSKKECEIKTKDIVLTYYSENNYINEIFHDKFYLYIPG